MEYYFDNSATTKPVPSVIRAMTAALEENYGNPSSLHFKGDEAERELSRARESISAFISAEADELCFTSGATESNNLAIFGTAQALRRRGRRIISTKAEHQSVSEPLKRLAEQGFECIFLPLGRDGKIDLKDLEEQINDETVLVSLMLVNNEIGSIMPVREAARIIKEKKAPASLHCDAVQALGKLPLNVKELGVDLLSASAHKLHGPKGQGFLYIRRGTKLVPQLLGGGQERGLRSGTHCLPGISGFAAAISEIHGEDGILSDLKHVGELKKRLIDGIADEENFRLNSPQDALPYIVNFSLEGIPSEVLRNFLSDFGICISVGSACSKGHRSELLTEIGLEPERVDSAVRISFSRYTEESEVDYLIEKLRCANRQLRKTATRRDKGERSSR